MIYIVVIDWDGKEIAIKELPNMKEPKGYSRNKNVVRGIVEASDKPMALSMTRRYLLSVMDEMIKAFDECIVNLKEHPEDYNHPALKPMTIAETASIMPDMAMPYHRWIQYEAYLNHAWDIRIYSRWVRDEDYHIQYLNIFVPEIPARYRIPMFVNGFDTKLVLLLPCKESSLLNFGAHLLEKESE